MDGLIDRWEGWMDQWRDGRGGSLEGVIDRRIEGQREGWMDGEDR